MADTPKKHASARAALRRLIRKHPTPAELEQALYELVISPDMTVAILGAALIESTLERLIESRFKSNDSNLIGRLFYDRGPLCDLNSKILVAQAFGIIPERFAAELQSLQAIRNVFAHAKTNVSFDHELIEKEIEKLIMHSSPLYDSPEGLGNRGIYAIAVCFCVITMSAFLRAREPASPDATEP